MSFLVPQKNGAFPYRFKRTLKPKAGLYAQSARALDTGGNASRTVTVRFPLK